MCRPLSDTILSQISSPHISAPLCQPISLLGGTPLSTASIMLECYSVFDPEPRLPSCMLRSYLLALKLKAASITI